MRWTTNIMDKVKNGIRSWLQVQPANPTKINIMESLDYEGNAIKNRIWYRGDSNELEQLYRQIGESNISRHSFWSSKSSPGMEINKIHTGLPSLIVDTLSNVTLASLNDFEFKNKQDEDIWKEINKKNPMKKRLEKATKETLYIGDGAFKVTFDESISEYPIIEYYPGDRIDIKVVRGMVTEIEFKTVYAVKKQEYILHEYYGYGYIKYKLTRDDKEVLLNTLDETKNLIDVGFSNYTEDKAGNVSTGDYMMAVPLMFFESGKWDGRGQSIFDRKTDSYDSFDEAWSQWMDALRAGRTKEYIPDALLPRNPNTGMVMNPNTFDNRYITTESDMREGVTNKIELEQPQIPHESYLATYITALDLCLQGTISPSTLGIDNKKLDNADAQREKEKATLYTRNAIVDALQEDLKQLVNVSIKAYKERTNQKNNNDIEVDVSFGEYANPSFESQVETVGKAKQQGIMSLEASVDELYGDNKDDDWKDGEVARLKAEQGIESMDEPKVNDVAGPFSIGGIYEGANSKQNVSNEQNGVQQVPRTNE